MSNSTTPVSKLPANYKEALYWKISEKKSRLIAMNLLAIPLAGIFWFGFYFIIRLSGKPPEYIIDDPKQSLLLLVGFAITIIVHELVHGLAMQFFGAQAKYGINWKGLMVYATAPGYAFQRNQYIVMALAPLVSLSALACCAILIQAGAASVWLFAVLGTLNGGAAIGDLWITSVALRYPSSAYVVDERDGMRIFLPMD
ncbi:MAG: DUF3267 domain-containing protein [Anaerolineales bacterium]|nr:DUF3267 domain-containing protein [Anaerolineales bacterium]